MANWKRFPIIPAILNYLWNFDEFHLPGKERTRYMDFVNKISTDKLLHGDKKHPMAIFVTGGKSIERMSKKIKHKPDAIKKCLGQLSRAGIIREIYKNRNKGIAYSDKYYIEYNNSPRKIAFLTRAKHERALRDFKPY